MSSIAKQPASLCCDKNELTYKVGIKSFHDVIRSINESLHANNSYKLSLYFNGNEDYIDLSLIKDNIESMEIIYNSNRNMNKMVMVYCENKQNLKEITFNFNTQENIYCGIINCSSNIIIKGGNNVITDIKTKINPDIRISIRGYNTHSICVSNSTMFELELEKIDDLSLNNVYYMKGYSLTGPITENIRQIYKLSIENIESYLQ